jgi:hypothetical protein
MTKLQFKTLYRNYRKAQRQLNDGDNDAVKCLWNQSNTKAYREAVMLVQGVYCKARYNSDYFPESNDYVWRVLYK